MKHEISTLHQGDFIFIDTFLCEVVTEDSGEYALVFDEDLNIAALRFIENYFHGKRNKVIHLFGVPYVIKQSIFFKATTPREMDALFVLAQLALS